MTKNKGLVFLRVVIIFITVAIVYSSTIYGTYSSAAAKVVDTIYLPVILNNYSNLLPPGNSVVHGNVYDTRTGEPIDRATVCLENSSLCDTTEVDGNYELQGVPTGGYTFIATVASSYDSVTKDLIIQSDTINRLDFGLLPWLDENELRVVVTWDPTPYWPPENKPNDLNLHMWIRTKDDYRVDIDNTGDCETIDAVFPFACYESDAQLGSGPDAIVLKNFESDTYTFAVLNYYAASAGVPSITSLSARVRVYDVSGLLRDYYVPFVGEGDLWYVFDLDYGVIVSKNCITQFDQSGDVPPECP